MLTTGGRACASCWASRVAVGRGGGSSDVTTACSIALKAACTSGGRWSTSSSWAAVSPFAPARAIPKASAMLAGDRTTLPAGSAAAA
jgi:hypothetical protein